MDTFLNFRADVIQGVGATEFKRDERPTRAFRRLFGMLLVALTTSSMCLPLFGQIKVEVSSEQITYLPHETLTVTVRIINLSGRDLHLGQNDSWLSFGLRARDGFIVPKISDVPVKSEFVVKSSEVGVRRVNLAPHYDLSRPGRYQVVANVRIPGWESDFQSPPKDVDISTGLVLWQEDFGVPGTASENAAPEVRRYALLSSNQLKVTKLYFRLTDSTGHLLYEIFPIGTMVSFGTPEKQIDAIGQLHVLHQFSARLFNYCVLTPSGQLKLRETYEITGSRPKLRGHDNGEVTVIGGMLKQPPRPVSVLPGGKPEDYRSEAENAAIASAPPAVAPVDTKEDTKKNSSKRKTEKPKTPSKREKQEEKNKP